MLSRTGQRSLLTLAGATAGIVTLAVGSPATAAPAGPADLEPDAPRDSWLPPGSRPAADPTSHGTCVTFIDFLPDIPIEVFVPSMNDGNTHCVLGLGNQSNAVRKLQLAIHDCYPDLRPVLGKVDGIYGRDTRNAVIEVQKRERVDPDGVYGPNTKNAMNWPGYLDGKLFDCLPLVAP